ncbi:hypothetical protein C8Q72DRAFT_252472 [Fomitopsis betulina]|nr:hypothetical protein C8Q72DRAFT_252472 [Fomitopsis betulina]
MLIQSMRFVSAAAVHVPSLLCYALRHSMAVHRFMPYVHIYPLFEPDVVNKGKNGRPGVTEKGRGRRRRIDSGKDCDLSGAMFAGDDRPNPTYERPARARRGQHWSQVEEIVICSMLRMIDCAAQPVGPTLGLRRKRRRKTTMYVFRKGAIDTLFA